MSGVVVARLLRWGRPSVHRPGYSPGHVEVPLGRVVTRPSPNRKPIPVGTVAATRDTSAGLEVTIRLREDAEGAEVAAEIVEGYRPGVDVTLQPLSSDPATFKPRARVHAIGLSALADPSGDGRVLSLDGHPLTAPDAVEAARRPVKPRAIKAAEELLAQAGAGASWWASVG
jgi:hypothetical protein